MPRYNVLFTPYFRSEEYQKSNERKLEKAIEDRFKSIFYIISKIWNHSPNKTENKEIFNHLKNQ